MVLAGMIFAVSLRPFKKRIVDKTRLSITRHHISAVTIAMTTTTILLLLPLLVLVLLLVLLANTAIIAYAIYASSSTTSNSGRAPNSVSELPRRLAQYQGFTCSPLNDGVSIFFGENRSLLAILILLSPLVLRSLLLLLALLLVFALPLLVSVLL